MGITEHLKGLDRTYTKHNRLVSNYHQNIHKNTQYQIPKQVAPKHYTKTSSVFTEFLQTQTVPPLQIDGNPSSQISSVKDINACQNQIVHGPKNPHCAVPFA